MNDFMDYLQGRTGLNKYAAGAKRYGPNASSAPNVGPSNPAGYMDRDLKAKALREAMLRRMQAGQKGQYASPAYQNPAARGY